MNTKSCTDLKQSKALAQILPFESADMYYPIEGASPKFGVALSISTNIPCWSLASLLEQLPCEICDDEGNSANLSIYKENDKYQLVYNSSFYEDFDDIETDAYEDFVDACVAMIKNLHELNLL